MIQAYKHILWDWNGTLLDDSQLCVDVLNHLLQQKDSSQSNLSLETYRKHFDFPVIHFYDFLGFDTDATNFEAISKQFIAGYEARWLEECRLHPEVTQLLETASEQGLSHSILSAAHQRALEIGTEHFGISHYFQNLLGTDNIYAEGKVARARAWMEQSPWDCSEVVLIGDTLHDFEVARAIGVPCLLLAAGHCHRQRLESTQAPVFNSLRELLATLH